MFVLLDHRKDQVFLQNPLIFWDFMFETKRQRVLLCAPRLPFFFYPRAVLYPSFSAPPGLHLFHVRHRNTQRRTVAFFPLVPFRSASRNPMQLSSSFVSPITLLQNSTGVINIPVAALSFAFSPGSPVSSLLSSAAIRCLRD